MPPAIHLLTPEYPPRIGGVSDYTRIMACELTQLGLETHVWAAQDTQDPGPEDPGVTLHETGPLVSFQSLSALGRALDCFPRPRRLVVQWVPHGFGRRSMNIPLCLWLWGRAWWHGDRVDLMVHEPSLGFVRGALRHNLVAVVHRLMLSILLHAVRHVYLSIPAWEGRLRPFALGRRVRFKWLPIPSNVAVTVAPERAQAIRGQVLAGRKYLIGHFGTHGAPIVQLLDEIVPKLLAADPDGVLLLVGQNSERVRARFPGLLDRVYATGTIQPEEISAHLQACDVILQPYPDGVSTRRTSAMASLAHGIPLVTTCGELSEEFWTTDGLASTVPAGDAEGLVQAAIVLLQNRVARQALGERARQIYSERFSASRSAARLADAAEQTGEAPTRLSAASVE